MKRGTKYVAMGAVAAVAVYWALSNYLPRTPRVDRGGQVHVAKDVVDGERVIRGAFAMGGEDYSDHRVVIYEGGTLYRFYTRDSKGKWQMGPVKELKYPEGSYTLPDALGFSRDARKIIYGVKVGNDYSIRVVNVVPNLEDGELTVVGDPEDKLLPKSISKYKILGYIPEDWMRQCEDGMANAPKPFKGFRLEEFPKEILASIEPSFDKGLKGDLEVAIANSGELITIEQDLESKVNSNTRYTGLLVEGFGEDGKYVIPVRVRYPEPTTMPGIIATAQRLDTILEQYPNNYNGFSGQRENLLKGDLKEIHGREEKILSIEKDEN